MKLSLLILSLAVVAPAVAETPTADAIALYKAKRYPEARAALEKITAAEPANAAACYYLGQTLLHRGDSTALDDAVKWLEKASVLEPANSTYLADYGGASLELAQKNTSLGAATRGRDAMEKAIALDPGNIEARAGLLQFYQEAPWPLGSSAKAEAQLAEIRKLDPDRATVLGVVAKVSAKDYAEAFKLCDEVLAKSPDNYTGLYHYGRTAAISGRNLERGLACLKKCLPLTPPGPSAPKPTNVWFWIGVTQEKLSHPADARQAYATALQFDGGNKGAADALAKLNKN